MIERIETSERMSKVVIHNGLAYLCGQVCADSSEPVEQQTESTLARVDALLQTAGSDREHILNATIYLRDMKDFAEMNKVWDNWVPRRSAPARACVEARLARPELLVEVSVVAAVIAK
ncbi:RidA family protein [Desulfotalea psychrophila]|uniref:Putative translation initiation inhibitor n=1 Tax=Desulfotalea psychrophila (strain LSv54 / DSM 12343) TaxID=177439 RepID=Q6AL04_DESPS|nr:RidA family protein [Desulfotalea psychrophila]CAG36971.1 putative translation initiation inhibitor [Desulfotalea psychrophila LSv54]